MMTQSKGMDLSVLGVTVGFALWVCVALSVLATFANPNEARARHQDKPMIEPATRSPVPVAVVTRPKAS